MDPRSQPSNEPQAQSSSPPSGLNSHPLQFRDQAAVGDQDNQYTYQNSDFQDPKNSESQSHQPRSAGRFTEEWNASRRGSSVIDGPRNTITAAATASNNSNKNANMERATSTRSYNAGDDASLPTEEHQNHHDQQGEQELQSEHEHHDHKSPHKGNTLKKKTSMRRNGSVKRSGSRRSMRAGSVRSLAQQSSLDHDEAHSAFHCPIPTTGNPTDVLANRFQTWRKILKDLIAYFREIQTHYEQRSKSLLKLANTSNNISTPFGFLTSAGIDDALQFLRNYNKSAILEANKAKESEEEVLLALTGLKSDLQQKIKEIKNLSGDFKNSVQREMETTGKVARTLSDALGKTEVDSASTTGKQDPFLLRLAVDRQVERQIDEENYLHQAHLNLENSGRELESIVVGEIQKAYNAYAGILKREADNAYNITGELREGPIAMPKDQEWIHFVTRDDQFVDPTIPLRTAEQIHYPGQNHVSAQEIRAGLLERKSKYLKSYTAGWYVLSTTHLHEFKSADKGQAPIMSLFLPEQKLGSHSTGGGSSNKFILKGRQTGSMHRGHTWVFRAESHDTMMAWYEDIKALTEKTPEERSQFVRSHSRSMSQSSRRSISSDGMVDEDDDEPFSASSQIDVTSGQRQDSVPRRAQPGGRFPSDIQINAQRGLQAPHSPSSISSVPREQDQSTSSSQAVAAAAGLPGSGIGNSGDEPGHNYEETQSFQPLGYGDTAQSPIKEFPSQAFIATQEARQDGVNPYTSEPVLENQHSHVQDDGFVGVIPAAHREQEMLGEPTPTAENPQIFPTALSYGAMDTTQPTGHVLQTSQDGQPLNELAATDSITTDRVTGGTEFNTIVTNDSSFPKTGFTTQGVEPLSTRESTVSLATTEASTLGELPPPRPISNTMRTDSAQTISNLHIPGGYPKNNHSPQ